jgi:hypothetical protein
MPTDFAILALTAVVPEARKSKRGPFKDVDGAPGDLVPALQISLPWPSFRTGAHAKVLSRVVRVAWSSTKMTDLQTKVEKYETKAAQCEERARQAAEGPQRAFHEGLSRYYRELATNFRQVIEKRKAA